LIQVHDNWDAIEASRSNQVGSDEEKGTDNDDTDSDKTATHVEGGDNDGTVGFATAKSAKVTISASTTMPSHSKSTFNKSRPSSRRIKQHTTNSRSKSTTGEARNTSSSQRLNESIGTFQKLAIGEEYSTMARTNANEGTLKVGLADYTRQMAWSADDAVSTLKAINNRDVSAGIGHVSSSYFDSKKGDSLRNPSLLYDLLQLLGEGSYGRVFKALHKESNAEVAIKIIPCDNQSDVTAELEFLRKLSCPYIVSFVDGFLFDDELWIAMEFCSAGSLSDLRELTKANLTEPQLRLALCYALLGLKHLHGLNCIHRDIKAGNILLTAAGEAKLADFGVSAQMQSATQKRRTVIGTPFWMAPEVIQETSYDYKADIWSLGVTALELCEGRPPHFEVHPMRAIFLIPIKPAPRLKEPSLWSAEMNDFVSRSLVKEADNRWSAEKLLEHPWLSGLVKDVERGHPPNDLQKLVADNIYLIQRTRELRRPSKHIMKRASVASSYDDEPEPDEASDDGSVATMEMGRDGSRETTLSSEAIAPSRRSADSEDTVDTFLVVRRGGNKSSDDDNSTWLNVDTLTNTPRYVSSEDQEESPEVQSTEEETTTFASAKEYFSNLVTKQVSNKHYCSTR
jgi:serine/threonine kinase 3